MRTIQPRGGEQFNVKDYRKYILKEYAFLKRPAIVIPGSHPEQADQVCIGSAPKTVKAMLDACV